MIELLPIDKIRPSADNLRRPIAVDDELRALRASIDSVGLLQPLVVIKAKDGNHQLVAGHRRHAACSIDPPIPEIECVVRELDESQRIGAMFIENFHRKDLTALEEAYGFQRLADERKLGQRAIAELCGCNQSHISRRLQLLKLPAHAQKALDDGDLLVREAEDLAKLAGDSKRIALALKNGRMAGWSMEQAIKTQLKDAANEAARKKSRAELDAAKVKVVKHPAYGWYGEKAKPIGTGSGYHGDGLEKLTAAAHKSEKCHAAAIKDDGTIVYVCTDPAKHKPKGTATRRVKSAEERRADAETKALKVASTIRKGFLAGALGGKKKLPARTNLVETFARTIVDRHMYQPEEIAALLGIDPVVTGKEHNARHYACTAALQKIVDAGGDDLLRLAVATLALDVERNMTSSYSRWHDDFGKRSYLGLLETLGYEPGPVELAKLNGKQLTLAEFAEAV